MEEEVWRPFHQEDTDKGLDIMLQDNLEGAYIWNVMGSSILYAADLIPEIADDIVNVDNAMKWGFAWNKGPFEMLDELDPNKVIKKCSNLGIKIPKMLQILENSSHNKFYSENEEFLSLHGEYEKIV